MAELNDPFGGSTQTLIDNADAALTALVNRVVAWQNLEVTETRNAHTRLLKIQELEAKNAAQKTEIDILEAQVESLEKVRKSWWPSLREEVVHPEYAPLVAAKNAQGLFQALSEKNIPQQLDPIPIAEVRAAISGVMAELALNGNMNTEVKLTWRTLLLDQITIMGNASAVPAALVQGLAKQAVESSLLPEGTVIGSKLVSRLEVLNLEGRVKSDLDIIEAMGWAKLQTEGI